MSPGSPLRRFVETPARDLLAGLDLALGASAGAPRRLLLVAIGLLGGWWIYVPLHELAHAFGCMAAGGTVSRLEIDAMYGAALLSRVFPFVHVGSEYAGRLSGFDTGGSDLVYLATDLAPFLLTLFPGVWWLRRAARGGSPLLFGAAVPWAFAPFVSLTGDAFEIGTLAAVNLPPAFGERTLVGDDLVRKAGELDFAGRPDLVGGFAIAVMVGVLWCFAWYALAGWLARRTGQPALEAASR